jgi:CRP-like cAMP-binding protein
MSLESTPSFMQILTSILIPLIVGLILGLNYRRIRDILPRKSDNTTVIKAILSEYTKRLEKYENAIADLRVRLDIMESRGHNHAVTQQLRPAPVKPLITARDISQDQSQPSFYAYHGFKKVEPVSEIDDIPNSFDAQNGTTEYVLKLLNEKSMTSREVQQAIGRSREHTSRLMKRLYEYRLISRNTKSKPYKYAITESGRLRLKEGHHVTHDARLDTTKMSHDSHVESSPAR